MSFKSLIRDVRDFPRLGIVFKDISPLLASPEFPQMIEQLAQLVDPYSYDLVAGIESRGFILGAALAQATGKGFVPIRKKGKLPPPVLAKSYALEYGNDTLEMPEGSGRILVVDDVLATGGTLAAAADLAQDAGYQVAALVVLLDLRYLNCFAWHGQKAHSLLQYES